MTPRPPGGEAGTGCAAGFRNASTAGGPLWAATFLKGTAIMLDPAGSLYAAIGVGNLMAFRDDSDNVGHAALANR